MFSTSISTMIIINQICFIVRKYNYSMDGGYCGRFYEWIINSIDYFIL